VGLSRVLSSPKNPAVCYAGNSLTTQLDTPWKFSKGKETIEFYRRALSQLQAAEVLYVASQYDRGLLLI
jgi:hypothetical protein